MDEPRRAEAHLTEARLLAHCRGRGCAAVSGEDGTCRVRRAIPGTQTCCPWTTGSRLLNWNTTCDCGTALYVYGKVEESHNKVCGACWSVERNAIGDRCFPTSANFLRRASLKLLKRSQTLSTAAAREVDVGGRAGCCGPRAGRRGLGLRRTPGAPPLASHAAEVHAIVAQAHGQAAAWRAGCAAPAVPPTCFRRCCTRSRLTLGAR